MTLQARGRKVRHTLTEGSKRIGVQVERGMARAGAGLAKSGRVSRRVIERAGTHAGHATERIGRETDDRFARLRRRLKLHDAAGGRR
jgi:hypothetical protein